MTDRQTSSNDRVAAVVAWGAIVSAVALVVVMLVMAWRDQHDKAPDAAASPNTTNALADSTFPPNASPPPGQEPGGATQVIAAVEQILAAYNDRDSAPLRAWACDGTTVTDDLFAGFSETVRFTRDGAPRIVGFTAEVPFAVRDEDRQGTGAMRLRWDGQRWCFVTAVSEPA
ncbi:MAG: hypothetical protein GEU97_13350 [Actinophytocola sp.]|nr:hypothetical protein [Actinophytocola sp.]